MLEELTHAAEQAATNVSRRHFLGRLARGAATTGAALGGLLALLSEAEAGRAGTRRCNRCRAKGLDCIFVDGEFVRCSRPKPRGDR